ncbi:MAG: hypothetical protein KKG00_08945 [Bacteroidetes bacterium]|nr:hypothetical protein [Bacteroidota bacterium]
MKNHLVNLLLEQFKQDYLVSRLDELGIEMQVASVDIVPIVFDIVGLPADNTADYYHAYEEGMPGTVGKKKFDSDYCSRQWLLERYHETVTPLLKKVRIAAVSRGLTFSDAREEEKVVATLADYVEWLYEQSEVVLQAREAVY